MKSFNVITGLPRSGSTLLCNVLNQNPAFHASSTSPLPELLGVLTHGMSHSDAIRSELEHSDDTTNRCNRVCRAVVDTWYEGIDKHVFDKSRGWTFHALLLNELYPEVKIIATVRDLRSVYGSVEKRHRMNPVFDQSPTPNGKTILARADAMVAPDGLIGQCVVGVEDIMSRMPNAVHPVVYEKFTEDPDGELDKLYKFLGLMRFDHDVNNVENVAYDADGLWLNKFPHNASGKITPADPNEWQRYVPDDLAALIHQRWPAFNNHFGYSND